MNDMKHTPAPWVMQPRIADLDGSTFQVVEIAESGPYRGGITRLQSAEHIGGIGAEETLANGRLIAAAPDLLAAIKGIHADTCSYICPSTGKAGVPILHDPRCIALRDAVAKAEGAE